MTKEQTGPSKNRTFTMGLIVAIFVIIAAIALYLDSQKDVRGEAPPGKVWSEEHGHYH